MDNRLKKPVVVGILACLACLLWGSAYPAVKIGYEWFGITDTSSTLLFAGYRFTMAGILTYAAGCLMERKILKIHRGSFKYLLLLGFVQTGVQYFFFYIGLANTTGVKGSIINAVNAFAAIILAHFFLKGDKLSRDKMIGCLLGMAGVVLVNISTGTLAGGFRWDGEGFLIIASLNYGIASILIKKFANRENPMVITAAHLLIGGLFLTAAGGLMGGHVKGYTMPSLLLMGYLVFLSSAAFSIWTLLLKYNSVGKVSVYIFLTPIFGVLLSGVFLGEAILSIQNLAALGLVSGGVYIVNRE